MIKLPKFTPYFLLFIVVSKVIYLLIEWYYNIHLIDTITTAKITEEMLTSIESLGHNVSSVGLTLLVTPFFYLLVRLVFKQISQVMMGISVSLFMGVSFFMMLVAAHIIWILERRRNDDFSSKYFQ